MNGARELIAALQRNRVEVLFGIPGVHTLPIYDALYDEPAVRPLVTRHEAGAGFAADGYARVTGRPGVCAVVPGPGATNLATAVGVAFADGVPLVAITSQIPDRLLGSAAVHDCDLEALYRPIVKACLRADRPEDVGPALDAAFRLALAGRPGPVQVLVTLEALGSGQGDGETRGHGAGAREVAAAGAPGQAAVRAAAEILNRAADPVVYAGSGVLWSGAADLVRALAERLGAPVLTSVQARGLLPEDHPLCAGILPWDGSRDLLGQADACLAVGTRFSEISTLGWSARFPADLIRVDPDERELQRNEPARLGVAADPRAFLATLLPLVATRPNGTELGRRVAEVQARRAADAATVLDAPPGRPIHPLWLTAALRRAFPAETIFTTDGTATEFWLSEPAFPLSQPRTLLLPEVSQTMGYALAAALGAKVGAPARPVCCVTGDGSLMMSVGELQTIVAEGLDLTVVIFDDGYYNALRIYQDHVYGGRRIGVRLRNPDFVQLAASFGAAARRVEDPAELDAALAWARDRRGLSIVDVVIDERPLPSRYRRRIEQLTRSG